MKYWKKRFERHVYPSMVSTNLLIEHLESVGFEIQQKTKQNLWFDRVVVDLNVPSYSVAGPKYNDVTNGHVPRILHICNASDIKIPKEEKLYCMLVLNNLNTDPSIESINEKLEPACTIICKTHNEFKDIASLHSIVLDFFLSMKEFTERLSIAIGPQGSFQKIVDIGEEFFNCFINITDANHMLLAYTQHIKPKDKINESLIKLGYHTEANLHLQRQNGYLPDNIAKQEGIQVYTPGDPFPYSLVTSVMHIDGQYVGYIVMATSQEEITDGTIDAFTIFSSYCEQYAQHQIDILPSQNSSTQAFLLRLIAEKNIDQSFLREQAEGLEIPIMSTFVLAQFEFEPTFRNQLSFVARNINEQIDAPHITLLFGDSIVLLLFDKSELELWNILALIERKNKKNIHPNIYVSDAFYKLSGSYYAFCQIAAIKKYEKAIRIYLSTKDSPVSNIFPFRYAFCFYWEDIYADLDIKHFSLSHLLINKIARNDEERKSNDLSLLFSYLASDRKATAVGQKFHLHRNGVLYRIKKMENEYGFNLDDCLTREYLQTSIRIKLASSQDFINLIEDSYSVLGENPTKTS